MGFGRGKVGSVVLARSKGQQVARAYNDAPKNPRSEGQMLQRSMFASAVKFFTQGRQAFYQFAFENKSPKQSDYNAFVSANAKRGMNISKAAFEEATYPVLAPWMMSKGSLPELDLEYDKTEKKFILNLPGLDVAAGMSELSQALIDAYGLNQGDIITVVTIKSVGSDSSNTPDISPVKREIVKWDIKQATIDTSSISPLKILFGETASSKKDQVVLDAIVPETSVGGACITISRVTEDGLKVNDSYLVLNEIAENVYNASKKQGYIDQVLASWKSTGKSILEGGMLPGPADITKISNEPNGINSNPCDYPEGDPLSMYVFGENLDEDTLNLLPVTMQINGVDAKKEGNNWLYDSFNGCWVYEGRNITTSDNNKPVIMKLGDDILEFTLTVH